LLNIRGATPDKYCLSLMDALFEDNELASSCFGTVKSTKPPLDIVKIKLIEGILCESDVRVSFDSIYLYVFTECVDERFGEGTYKRNFHALQKKCNQKCLDTSKRLKRLQPLKE